MSNPHKASHHTAIAKAEIPYFAQGVGVTKEKLKRKNQNIFVNTTRIYSYCGNSFLSTYIMMLFLNAQIA